MPIQRALKRQFTITKTDEGYTLTPPKHRGLVLSGGGAKGIGYAGLIKAMDEQGQLKDITHVSGASAGAMTASLLAIGISSAKCEKLMNDFDLFKLLDTEGIGRVRAVGERFRNVLELIYMQQIKEHIAAVKLPLSKKDWINYMIIKQKIGSYEKALKDQGLVIDNLQDVINLTKDNEQIKKLDLAFRSTPKAMKRNTQNATQYENPRLNFLDLGRLRELLPENKKHLIKSLTVVATNQSKRKLEHYSESQGANESIAEVVQQSGAHPLLFTPAANTEGDIIADGGIVDNMPTEALERLGLKKEEIFCAKIEDNAAYGQRVQRAQSYIPEQLSAFYGAADKVIISILGGELFKGRADVINREKVFYRLENMIYINSGSLSTATKAPTPAQKKDAIDTAYQQTKELLARQVKVFDNSLTAILYLGDKQLDNLLTVKDSKDELFINAFRAKRIFLLQLQLIKDITNKADSSVKQHISDIEDELIIAKLNSVQIRDAMSLCLKQIDYKSEGRLEQHLISQLIKADKAKDAKEIGFFMRLLELLYAPIAWIISKFTSSQTNTVKEDKKQTVIKEASKHKMSIGEVCGLFVKASGAKREEAVVENDKLKPIEPK